MPFPTTRSSRTRSICRRTSSRGGIASADPIRLSAYGVTDAAEHAVVNLDVQRGRNFSTERAAATSTSSRRRSRTSPGCAAGGKRVVLAGLDRGLARAALPGDRRARAGGIKPADSLKQVNEAPKNLVITAVLGIEAGFETPDLAVVGEQDILGDRLVRRGGARSARRTSSPRPRASTRATSSSMSTTASAASSA